MCVFWGGGGTNAELMYTYKDQDVRRREEMDFLANVTEASKPLFL